MFCVRGASRALRANHENPPRRGIGLTADWSPRERQRTRASSASAAPAASTPPGFPQRGGTRKSHERSRKTCRTQGRGKGSRCWRKAHGPFLASSSFVTFRAIFVSRDFGITRRVGTWRRRRVKRSFEPGDGSALPIAEGDLPRSRVFVFRAKRREARHPPRPPPAQSPHRKNPFTRTPRHARHHPDVVRGLGRHCPCASRRCRRRADEDG